MTDELLTSTTLESDIEILNKYVNMDNELHPTIKETLNSFYENNGQKLNDENGVLESYP